MHAKNANHFVSADHEIHCGFRAPNPSFIPQPHRLDICLLFHPERRIATSFRPHLFKTVFILDFPSSLMTVGFPHPRVKVSRTAVSHSRVQDFRKKPMPVAILRLSMHTTSLHPIVPAGMPRYPAHHAHSLARPAPERTQPETVRGCVFAPRPLWAAVQAMLSIHKSAPGLQFCS